MEDRKVDDRRQDQDRRAEERARERTRDREDTRDRLRDGGIARANSKERLQLREQRLEMHRELYDETRRSLEAVVGNPDFLDAHYLERGATAQRAVARVAIRADGGGVIGFGTGFMVSPRLLLTNNHVLASEREAASSQAEFDFQEGPDGTLGKATVFDLDPDAFFLTDERLDFTLVAVRASEADLRPFGFRPLIANQGKIVLGECVSIVQHPDGRPKEVALRNNRVMDLFEDFIHYETDTEPGSSGSKVANDQWEVVALHHASVETRDGGVLNEGIRISSIVGHVRAQPLEGEAARLRDELLAAGRREAVPSAAGGGAGHPPHSPRSSSGREHGGGGGTGGGAVTCAGTGDGGVTVTIPLEITVRLGGGAPSIVLGEGPGGPGGRHVAEAISIDPDYSTRRGYSASFLGSGGRSVPLPRLSADMERRAARNRQPRPGDPPYVLPYHHFSVVMNAARRLAFFTAVNIDGEVSRRIRRDPDRWIRDPRIGADEQTDEAVYRANDLDRGHLVRRLDPAWGSAEEAKRANDDTFHFANCSTQHSDFNQGDTLWAGLEDYILDNTDVQDLKVSVFTGHVFDDENDIEYRGVRLPLQYWKVVAMVRESGGLSATGYLLSQEELLRGMGREAARVRPESFQFGAYRTFQVPVRRIESLTGLDFGALGRFDPLAGREAARGAPRALTSYRDLRL